MEDFLKFIIIGFLISIPIGPTVVLCFQRVVQQGFTSGLFTGLGVAFSDLFYALAVIYSIQFFSSGLGEYSTVLKLLSFAIILFIGLRGLSKKFDDKSNIKVSKISLISNFTQVLIYSLLNPVSLIIFLGLATSSTFDDNNRNLFPLGIFIGSIIWWLLINLIFLFLKRRLSLKHLKIVNIITSIILILFSFYLLFA